MHMPGAYVEFDEADMWQNINKQIFIVFHI